MGRKRELWNVSRRLLKVEEVGEPRIGERYLVRCGEAERQSVWSHHRLRYVPLLGPIHEDAEFINFPDYHFHVDWRFISNKVYEALLHEEQIRIDFDRKGQGSYKGKLLKYTAPQLLMAFAVTAGGSRGITLAAASEYRPMRMVRLHTIFPEEAHWMKDLETKYANARLRPGLICPHRGISCAGVRCAGDVSTVVCPGHGLAWNRETGRLVPRDLLRRQLRENEWAIAQDMVRRYGHEA